MSDFDKTDYVYLKQADLTDMLVKAQEKGAENGWKFCNDCYVKTYPAIASWLAQETRYPYGMTYAEACASFEAYKDKEKKKRGIVFWGYDLPQVCDDCPCWNDEYSVCMVISKEFAEPCFGRLPDCPAEEITREDV